jgi:hypothetical protein
MARPTPIANAIAVVVILLIVLSGFGGCNGPGGGGAIQCGETSGCNDAKDYWCVAGKCQCKPGLTQCDLGGGEDFCSNLQNGTTQNVGGRTGCGDCSTICPKSAFDLGTVDSQCVNGKCTMCTPEDTSKCPGSCDTCVDGQCQSKCTGCNTCFQGANRTVTLDACVAAAKKAGADLSGFDKTAALVNAPTDAGAGPRGITLRPDTWNVSFAAQEMAHAYGLLNHSRRTSAPNEDYGDRWDVMSTYNGISARAGQVLGWGPSMSATNRMIFGWMPSSRVQTWGVTPGNGWASTDFTIAAINHPEVAGALAVEVPTGDKIYVLEYRPKEKWDQGNVADVILVHEKRAGDRSWLVQNGEDRIGGFYPGAPFADVAANVRVTVLSFDPVKRSATVNVRLDHLSGSGGGAGGRSGTSGGCTRDSQGHVHCPSTHSP